MNVSVEDISSVRKSLKVEVPQETVSHTFDHLLEHLQKDVRMPGFRPGKAPQSLLIKKYAETLREELLRKLIPEYCQKAMKETKLSPVDTPTIQKIDFDKGERALRDTPLSFVALVDILPEIRPSNYTGLTLSQKEVHVTDDDLEKELTLLQDQQGHLETLPDDHVITSSDYVIIDFVGERDGKPLEGAKREGYSIEIGAKAVRPEIEAALIGKKKGDRVIADMVDEHPEKGVAGKTTHFKIDIKEIKTKKRPALDDEFAKDIGLTSLAELKEKIKGALEVNQKARQKQDQKNVLLNKLIELHPIEVPQPMVERELQSILRQARQKVELPPEHQKGLMTLAENRVRGSLILMAIAEKEKIEVSDQELEEAIKQTTQRIGVPFEKGKRDIMRDPAALRGMKGVTQEEKTLEWVYSQAQFEAVK